MPHPTWVSMATRVHRKNPQYSLENRKCECEHDAQRQKTLLTIPLTIFYCKAMGSLCPKPQPKIPRRATKGFMKQSKKPHEKCGRSFKIFLSGTLCCLPNTPRVWYRIWSWLPLSTVFLRNTISSGQKVIDGLFHSLFLGMGVMDTVVKKWRCRRSIERQAIKWAEERRY